MTYNYIYTRWPMVMLFVCGYILFRVIAAVGLPEYLAGKASLWCRGRIHVLLLILISVCAGLSMFIPNAVTVLAMLPVLKKLDNENEGLTTALTLSIIYGANIGGMGSLIGSPANLILLGALDFLHVDGSESINFFSWFIWALPAVIVFILIAWGVVLLAVPAKMKSLKLIAQKKDQTSAIRFYGLKMAAIYMIFWSVSSISANLWGSYKLAEPVVCTLFFAVFLYLAFIYRPVKSEHGASPILKVSDMLKGVPLGGIKLLILLGLVFTFARLSGFDQMATNGFKNVFSSIMIVDPRGYLPYLLTAGTVIILTEVLSNTVVSTAFFPIVFYGAQAAGLQILPLMILVSVSSTCAFMTPIATPCNGLAYGEMKHTSLNVMILLGFILNITGAAFLSFWMYYVFPFLSI